MIQTRHVVAGRPAVGATSTPIWRARAGEGRRPGIVLVHDMFGLNASIRYIADEFARRGHAVLVPNMFWRSAIPQALAYDEETASGRLGAAEVARPRRGREDVATAVALAAGAAVLDRARWR